MRELVSDVEKFKALSVPPSEIASPKQARPRVRGRYEIKYEVRSKVK